MVQTAYHAAFTTAPGGLTQALDFMRKLTAVLLTASALAGPPLGLACSVPHEINVFTPKPKAFRHKNDFPPMVKIPSPTVEIVSFEKASNSAAGSCSANAKLVLDVSMPKASDSPISEVGLFFQAEKEKPQDFYLAFPNYPIQARALTRGRARFTFYLIDSPDKPFDLKIFVMAINHGLQLSPPTELHVKSP